MERQSSRFSLLAQFHILPKLCSAVQSAGSLSLDVPSMVQFVPGTTKVVAYTSPLLLGKVLLFDYRLASVVRCINLPQMVRSMHVAHNGRMLAFGGTGGSVFTVEAESGRWNELTGHVTPVAAVQFTGDSRRLVSAAGHTMFVWAVSGHFAPSKQEVMDSKII